MQTKSEYRSANIGFKAVGLAIAGSALFVLGFHSLVDSPRQGPYYPAALGRIAFDGRALLRSVHGATVATSAQILHNDSLSGAMKVLHGPAYHSDDRISSWMRRTGQTPR